MCQYGLWMERIACDHGIGHLQALLKPFAEFLLVKIDGISVNDIALGDKDQQGRNRDKKRQALAYGKPDKLHGWWSVFQDKAQADLSMEQFFVIRLVNFVTKVIDIHIYDVGAGVKCNTPHLIEYLHAVFKTPFVSD
jgi:hypothetical protein